MRPKPDLVPKCIKWSQNRIQMKAHGYVPNQDIGTKCQLTELKDEGQSSWTGTQACGLVTKLGDWLQGLGVGLQSLGIGYKAWGLIRVLKVWDWSILKWRHWGSVIRAKAQRMRVNLRYWCQENGVKTGKWGQDRQMRSRWGNEVKVGKLGQSREMRSKHLDWGQSPGIICKHFGTSNLSDWVQRFMMEFKTKLHMTVT